MYRIKKTLEESFWNRVAIIPFHPCWEWIGNQRPDGYGLLDYAKKTYRAHRLSWALHFGMAPDELHVCHKCDNPSCVRPDHLFLGTDRDNTLDCISKGRFNCPKGINNHKSKLTELQIEEIKASNLTHRQLAEKFGVSHHSIGCIKRGQTWKHLSKR